MATDDTPIDSEPPQFLPYTLMRSTRTLMGDIITIGAELDLLLSLALFKISELDPTRGFVLFGSLQISKKVEQILRLLRNEGPVDIRERFLETKPALDDFIKARNTIAHGVLAGRIGDSACFFVTNNVMTFNETAAVFVVRRLKIDGFKDCKRAGEILTQQLRQIFDVAPLLETIEYTILKHKPQRP